MTDEVVVERGRATGDPEHAVRIEIGAFGPWETNAYLVWDGRSDEALVIDPGMDAADALVARAADTGLRIHLIANSHGHIDHIFDNAALKRASGAPLAIHPDDAYRLSGENIYGLQVEASLAEQDLREGEVLSIGALRFRVLHTPGHTEGSVCLYEADRGLLL
ncbi:MAG TPA: MBL fold metallo-hydrolase, partial [Pleomorphomonadaceae bacterium]|nr:MBL fold metallo-hydrolase [Pleomorphomonadaceae bacterium]